METEKTALKVYGQIIISLFVQLLTLGLSLLTFTIIELIIQSGMEYTTHRHFYPVTVFPGVSNP